MAKAMLASSLAKFKYFRRIFKSMIFFLFLYRYKILIRNLSPYSLMYKILHIETFNNFGLGSFNYEHLSFKNNHHIKRFEMHLSTDNDNNIPLILIF